VNLSVVVITYNEEANIERALKSVAWADEIVVVDSESTDRTVEICRRYTDRVITRPWEGYIAQKNFALSQAAHDWVLSIDADEEVSPELAESIGRAMGGDHRFDGYMVKRRVFYLGRWINHCGWYPDWRTRLVLKGKARWVGDQVHETLEVDGSVGRIEDGDLNHYSYRNISDHLARIDRYTTLIARRNFESKRRARWYALLLRPIFNFFKKYFLQLGFLDGRQGFIVCVLASYYVFLKYAKLWELQRTGKHEA